MLTAAQKVDPPPNSHAAVRAAVAEARKRASETPLFRPPLVRQAHDFPGPGPWKRHCSLTAETGADFWADFAMAVHLPIVTGITLVGLCGGETWWLGLGCQIKLITFAG